MALPDTEHFGKRIDKFAQALGVSHASVLHWENEVRNMNTATEINMRLYLLNHLKVTDKEFRKTYNQFDIKTLSSREAASSPLEIDAEKIACLNFYPQRRSCLGCQVFLALFHVIFTKIKIQYAFSI